MKRLALLALVCACGKQAATDSAAEVVLDPTRIPFGSREYTVRPWEERFEAGFYLAAGDDSRKLVGRPVDSRQLAPCPKPRLVLLDADADGKRDVLFYTCGAVEIFVNQAQPIGRIEPVVGERKERHWVRPDPAQFPGLDKLVPLIHQIDPDLE